MPKENKQWQDMSDWLFDQGAVCLWQASPRNCHFTLEGFALYGGKRLVIFQIFKKGGFEIYDSSEAPGEISACKEWLEVGISSDIEPGPESLSKHFR
jgi:hypothetical protein